MRFPFYKQLDKMDCGPACLRMVAAYYGKTYSLQKLRDKCHISRQGVSLLGISDAAESIGFRTTGVKITWQQLKEEVKLPCIVHWNQNHFVVLYKIREKKGKIQVCVADPAEGLISYPAERFLQAWLQAKEVPERLKEFVSDTPRQNKGIVLLLEPTPDFYREKGEEDQRMGFADLFRYFRPYYKYLVQLGISILMASGISLILPFLTQAVVDKGIGLENLHFIVVILIAQVMLVIGQAANNLIRSWLMLHMTTRIGISLISDFLAKLMRLPIAFFDARMVGDIMQRIGDYNRIQVFISGTLLGVITAVVSFFVYSLVMAAYDPVILLLFIIGSALNMWWILLFMKRRRRLDYMRFQEASANQNNLVQLINGMQDIKLNNCEKQKRWEWENIQAKLYKINIKSLTLGQTQEIGGIFIDQAKNVLISFLAAKAVIEGEMTLGMMVALQYIIGQLNAPLSQFIQFVQASQDAKISLERLGEIQEQREEEPEDVEKIGEIPENADIELRDVVFQYDGPHSDKVLDHIDLRIPSDKVTAIVGTSGSGKTTLLKLILGFYAPVSGQLLLGNRPLKLYSERAWRRQCGVVMQEGYIFSDTIANNIGVSDAVPDMSRIVKAAETANLQEFIDSLPLHYNTKVGVDGHGLSTGQKQRLLIARAAYRNAKFLILDEATNSLDANNEKFIMEKLQTLFKNKTVIIVAHRLSTVKNADHIVVLDKGRIREKGTHASLIAERGYYYELVRNQLELGN